METLQLEAAKSAEPELFAQVGQFSLTRSQLRQIFEDDTSALYMYPLSLASDSNSTYRIEPLGPTVEATYYGGTARVRKARYVRTRSSGEVNSAEEYIGLTHPEARVLKLRFFKELNMPQGSAEHSTMQIPTSSDLLEEGLKLVFTGENNE